MSQELLILLLPPVGWVLAWLGGRGVLGTKIWIREGWPLYCALIGVLAGQPWWQMALGAAAMDVAYRLPRGEGEPLWVDVLTALALGVHVGLDGDDHSSFTRDRARGCVCELTRRN